MANYNGEILSHVLGYSALAAPTDWWVGLWAGLTDPFTDLFAADLGVPRVYIGNNLVPVPGNSNEFWNNSPIYFNALPASTPMGWYVANGEFLMIPAWVARFNTTFFTPTLFDGDSLVLPSQSLILALDTTYAPPGTTGGGGGPG